MYRMMIVDDEAHIVEGLYEFFSKDQSLELDILKAHSAKEALDWLQEFRIDLVLSDISMPQMNGLDLVKEIEGNWPRCKVILLTGYTEFDYAQRAIRSQVIHDYLLKTEGMDQVKQTVKASLSRLTEELETSHQSVLFKEKMPKVLYDLQKTYLKRLLEPERGASRMMDAYFDALQLGFRADENVLVSLAMVEDWGKYVKEDRHLILYSIGKIAEELLGKRTVVKAAELNEDAIAILVQSTQTHAFGEKKRLLTYVHGTLESFQETCRSFLGLSVSVASLEHALPWAETAKGVNRLRKAILRGPAVGMEKWMVVSLVDIPAAIDEPDRKKAAVYVLDLLFQAILKPNRIEAEQHFQTLRGLYSSQGPTNSFDKMQILHALSNHLLFAIEMIHVKLDHLDDGDLRLLTKFDSGTNWTSLLTFFRGWINRLLDYREQETGETTEVSRQLDLIHHYIHNHLEDNLSLAILAGKVGLNPSYLSRWYKKNAGEALSDYINRVRISKAKELLVSSEMRVSDISSKLGFTDPHYFFRFFKKIEKCTPTEFRERSSLDTNKFSP
ncbi:response regulator [Paenibacillus silvae]|uniref:DNA-binding response regulator n=1 Tax=Paenibacillus silvae TaxID=1325358 RepID=A0A2W6P343_9BACL|nr:response regulator [Paenibacillus silvae]PZT54100.1 DNA-binding response regulator [Paenibacillus silvae]